MPAKKIFSILLFFVIILSIRNAGSYVCSKTILGLSRLPDTGQTAGFTSTFGEDSNYSTNPPYFTDNSNWTITDNVTGLMRQKIETSKIKWEKSLQYIENNTLAGRNDWRLPNIKYLKSLSNNPLFYPYLEILNFPGANSSEYRSSTTLSNHPGNTWFAEFKDRFENCREKTRLLNILCEGNDADGSSGYPETKLIPGGEYEMGDHHNLGGVEHGNDEIPIHTVYIDSFSIGITEITNLQYCGYLNSALYQGIIEVRGGLVYAPYGNDIYCETYEYVQYSGIGWNGNSFSVLNNRSKHPVVGVRWFGAAAYCNWLSAQKDYRSCYDPESWECDFSVNGFRLPTEAEWEYAARGGNYNPYYIFPWGDDGNNKTRANWPNSGDPFETGPYPWTTPVAFYNGLLHNKTEFNWPGSRESYQTSDGSNNYGLFDMSGNVWEWINDWYNRDYYSVSPYKNPKGPDSGSPMPDGKSYKGLRGGNWYNGNEYWGHSRAANRNPSYYRGPDDPEHAWYHIGFRVARGNPDVVSGIEDSGNNVRTGFELYQNYPNPFNPHTTIKYNLPSNGTVRITIYNLNGQQVTTLVNEFKSSGNYKIIWDGTNNQGKNVSSGIYLYKINFANTAIAKKMLLIR